MIRAVAIRILRQILLVTVGAEAYSLTEFTELSRRGQAIGRLSVGVAFDPAVDQATVQSKRRPFGSKRPAANGGFWTPHSNSRPPRQVTF